MEDKIFYVTYRGINVAWYNSLDEAMEEARERYDLGATAWKWWTVTA